MGSHINNVFGIRINTIMNNGSVNLGNALHTHHQANLKVTVGYWQNGDANNSPLQFYNANYVNDPDIQDQNQQQL